MNELSQEYYNRLKQLSIQYNKPIEEIATIIGIHQAYINIARMRYDPQSIGNELNIPCNINILGRMQLFYELLQGNTDIAHDFEVKFNDFLDKEVAKLFFFTL